MTSLPSKATVLLKRGIATSVALLSISGATSAATPGGEERHTVTLDDAYQITEVGAVRVNRTRRWIALEVGGSIQIRELARNGRLIKQVAGRAPSWSPDGQTLAYFAESDGGLQVFTWSAANQNHRQVTMFSRGLSFNPYATYNACSSTDISWAPDSSRIVIAGSLQPRAQPASPIVGDSTNRDFGPTFPLEFLGATIDGVYAEPDPAAPPTVEQRVRTIALNRLIVIDIGTGSSSELSGRRSQYSCPAWSPDGNTIAAIADTSEVRPFFYASNQSATLASTLVLFDFNANQEAEIAVPGPRIGGPAWAPDGSRISFTVIPTQRIQGFIPYIYSLRDRRAHRVATPGNRPVSELGWSVDGRHLFAKLTGIFTDTLWRLDPGNGRQAQITTFDWRVGYPFHSFDEGPDGSVAFVADTSTFRGRVILTSAGATGPVVAFDANPQLSEIRLGSQRRMTWRNSRGELVDGIVILPPDYRPGRRYPVLVNAYPAPPWDQLNLYPRFEETGQLQAAWGYVVFKPSLRAPHGAYWFTRGEQYTLQSRGARGIPTMVDDFESGIRHLIAQGIADSDRIAIYGHSNGGWLANMLLVRTQMIRAAIVQSGISNAFTMSFVPQVHSTRGADPATGGNVFDDFGEYRELSPIFDMRELRTPMLLMIGDRDINWIHQIIPQYSVLRSEGRDVELVRYGNEGHVLNSRSNIEDALRRMRLFLAERLDLQLDEQGVIVFDSNRAAARRESTTTTP